MPEAGDRRNRGTGDAAGCQLVATCDLAICTDTATFCTPGVNIGLFCSTPMVAVSRAAHRKQAMEMLLTGETIDASNAKDFGLVNRIVPKEYLHQVVDKYAAVIASKSPLTLKIGKEAFYRQIDMPLEEAYAYTGRVMTENMLARDAEEGIGAFLDKRHPNGQASKAPPSSQPSRPSSHANPAARALRFPAPAAGIRSPPAASSHGHCRLTPAILSRSPISMRRLA